MKWDEQNRRFLFITMYVSSKMTVGRAQGLSIFLQFFIYFFVFFFSVELLTGPHWINDQIIAFYFQYLEWHVFKTSSERILFVSPAVTQLLKMSPAEETKKLLEPIDPGNKKKVIFFAVNDNDSTRAGGTHWSLLVFSRAEQLFASFDSMKPGNRAAAKKLFDTLKSALNSPSANFHEVSECTQQANCYDCGIHLLVNVENIAEYYLEKGAIFNAHNSFLTVLSQVAHKRREILEIISQMGGNIWSLSNNWNLLNKRNY